MIRPEDYWINLGENVIGLDALHDGDEARQAPTYQAIVEIVLNRRIRHVLDVGCNLAQLANFLYGAGYEGDYVGVDSNPYVIEGRGQPDRNTPQWSCFLGNLRDIEYANETRECVVVKDVIEHLESIQPLREAFRVAKRYVIIATYLPWHDEPSIIHQHEDGYYTNVYKQAEIVDLARDCGFVLIEDHQVNERNGMPNQVTLWERI